MVNKQADTMFNMSITERITERRTELGMKSIDLAKKVGVTRGAVSQWESGKVENIRPENLIALADALEVTVRWLATGKGAKEGLSPDAREVAERYASSAPAKRQAFRALLDMADEHGGNDHAKKVD